MREREMDRIAMIRTIAAKLVKLSFDYGYIKSSNLSQTNLNKCIKKLDKITNEFAKQTSLLRLCLYQSYYDRYEKKVLKAMDKVTDEYTNLNKGSKVKHLDEFIDAVRLYEMHKKVEEQ
ncbi:hypothetical protein N4627_05575 [Limosilactobacillus vaginalis]|uniref:hypothetical protein n=1 Tax=Limosilactobacillus vaginalis TaxID=1633 RepID=UPI0021B5CECF|nr:hypothetical protein [Limosilactobacillus vaginalis]UXC68568.1 hypothetical protein N4627_05575 [Limosilactobacillus vaginalis]